MTTLEASIAVNRFGLGATTADLARAAADPRAWLDDQINDPGAFLLPVRDLPTSAQAGASLTAYLASRRQTRTAVPDPAGAPAMSEQAQMAAVVQPLRQLNQATYRDIAARVSHGLTTETGFAERLVYFWSNHFTVAATKAQTIPFVGPFEREAIRPHLTGSFADLLIAAIQHPGMLLYLDQVQSTGPNSRVGQRRDGGLNENLAREILELHTVGVHAGYTQNDVIEFAKALTGWVLAGERTQRLMPQAQPGAFVFLDAMHEPGARTVLGVRYPEGGVEQGLAILRDLARRPATARHVATKLARHFVADTPPAELVAHLEGVYLETEGDLPSLHRALFTHDTAWRPEQQKLKTPNEFLLSAMRLTGQTRPDSRDLLQTYQTLGQPPFRAPSPAGWPDDAASWSGPDALMKRIEWAQAFAEGITLSQRPEDVAATALGPLFSDASRQSVRRAESPSQGLVLALMSPEFQRR